MRNLLLSFILLGLPLKLLSQDANPSLTTTQVDTYYGLVEQKFRYLNAKVSRATEKVLERSQKQEQRIYKKLLQRDTTAARIFLMQSQEHYRLMQEKFELAKNV